MVWLIFIASCALKNKIQSSKDILYTNLRLSYLKAFKVIRTNPSFFLCDASHKTQRKREKTKLSIPFKYIWGYYLGKKKSVTYSASCHGSDFHMCWSKKTKETPDAPMPIQRTRFKDSKKNYKRWSYFTEKKLKRFGLWCPLYLVYLPDVLHILLGLIQRSTHYKQSWRRP